MQNFISQEKTYIVKSTTISNIFFPRGKKKTMLNYDNSLYYIINITSNITKNNALHDNEINSPVITIKNL